MDVGSRKLYGSGVIERWDEVTFNQKIIIQQL